MQLKATRDSMVLKEDNLPKRALLKISSLRKKFIK